MSRIEITRFPPSDYLCEEAMNTLCTNLSYCGADVRTVMVTSRYAREGKSYVCMNLLRSLSRLGRRVALVDADLRASGIQSHYSLRFPDRRRLGLTDYLAGKCEAEDALYESDLPGAWLIPAGHEAPNPLQLLITDRMEKLLIMLRQRFDTVLIDTPPGGIIADAIALGRYCDGALIVVSYRRGKKSDIGELSANLKRTGCHVLGAVLNGVNFGRLSNRRYYYNSERYSSYRYRKYGDRYGGGKDAHA